MKKILITGGLGFIGSHTAVELQNQGFEVHIIDNLSNSKIDVLDGIEKITSIRPFFYKIDLRNKTEVINFFKVNKKFSGIIHFAAYKAVGDSVQQPLNYYENNIVALLNILQTIDHADFSLSFIFSSSCTVYGQAAQMPIKEEAPVQIPQSPYGNTKQIGEEILRDLSLVKSNIKTIALRYFNPIGAHPSLYIGELPLNKPQNLIPLITQTAAGLNENLTVFGNDYDTTDGTCVRDYIDVMDLARAHVAALNRLLEGSNKSNFECFNLGSGQGRTVLEVIDVFEKVSNTQLNYVIGPRRIGDVSTAYADTSLANKELNWQTEVDLNNSILNAWRWEKKIRGIL